MKLIEILTDYFSHPAEKTVDKTPNGICALCWGYERYDGKIREMFKDKQIDVNNHRARYMLIQEFLANQVKAQN